MSHSHSGIGRSAPTGNAPLVDPDELHRHRRALRILIVVLIPLAIWTLVGLIAFWPGDISANVNKDVAGYNVAGVTYPTARITTVVETSCDGLAGSTPGVTSTRCANVTAQLRDGDDTGQSVTVPLTGPVYASGAKVGQDIKLIRIPPADGQPAQFQFSDFERRTPLIVMAVVFALVVIAVARWRGFAALVGLGFSGFILVRFMFPALVAGSNPVMVGLIGSSAIMFVVLYATHGFSARTTTALVGTLFGLVLIAALGYFATRWAHLTGVSAEEDYVLGAAAPNLKLTSVVICGVIVAGLGVLNDVTITQASAVWELADSDRSSKKLFTRAMRIGRDHIASTVYTIAFATAGASLSVLLLIAVYDRPLFQVLQTEQFAGEIVRTLVGSIGLVLAVPLTTAIGAAVVRATGRETGVAAKSAGRMTAKTAPETAATASAKPREANSALGDNRAIGDNGALGDNGAGAEESDVETTTVLPAISKRRRRRSEAEDDEFGDFSDLRDPSDPRSRDRRPR